ncbi:MAG: DUF1330 domain-containing protein [Saprospiraceae bacterium]|nr:DUF1330 domain-containing protein [Saprospiraceae bacterium]
MHETSRLGFLDATQEAGKAFYRRQIEGSVVMMNLLKFRQIADYSGDQDLAPSHEVSGEEAYRLYMKHTLPFLLAAGGEVIFRGKAGPFLIGPAAEDWDLVLLVRHQSVSKFLAFANDDEYQSGIGHRTAALIDSRLLPLEQVS